MNQIIQSTDFNGAAIDVISHDGQRWITAEQAGQALGYAPDNARRSVGNLYKRNAQEFGPEDTCVIKLMTGSRGMQDTRLFSATGCNLLGFFSDTARAKEFRAWAKLTLTRPVTVVQSGTDAALNAKIDKLLDLMEQMLKVIPKLVEAARPPSNRGIVRKKMYAEDVERILALRAKGYLLDELVAETDFSQSQCWAVMVGRYKVLESGRVSIDLRTDVARAADAAAKAQRAQGVAA